MGRRTRISLNLCPGLTKTEFGVRAGMHDFRTDLLAETPEQVVEIAFRHLQKNGPTAVSGWKNRLLLAVERAVPHRWLLRGVEIYQKARSRQ